MGAKATEDYFALFGLRASFDLDRQVLTERYRELQRQVHPDRHAAAGERARLLSVQRAAQVNDAFNTLKSPISRARYLLSLHGIQWDDDTSTAMDPAFLMEQMELREALEEARGAADSLAAIGQVMARIQALERTQKDALRQQFADGSKEALEAAAETTRKLQFLARLQEEAEAMEADLD